MIQKENLQGTQCMMQDTKVGMMHLQAKTCELLKGPETNFPLEALVATLTNWQVISYVLF